MSKFKITISATFEADDNSDEAIEGVRELVCQLAENEEVDFKKEFNVEVKQIS